MFLNEGGRREKGRQGIENGGWMARIKTENSSTPRDLMLRAAREVKLQRKSIRSAARDYNINCCTLAQHCGKFIAGERKVRQLSQLEWITIQLHGRCSAWTWSCSLSTIVWDQQTSVLVCSQPRREDEPSGLQELTRQLNNESISFLMKLHLILK